MNINAEISKAVGVERDYEHCLNAMHEAEKVILGESPHDHPWVTYRLHLLEVCGDYVQHATAAQRAEAFLRTLGPWKE